MRFPVGSLAIARALRGPSRGPARRGASTGGGPPQGADAGGAPAPVPARAKTSKEITREHDDARYGNWQAARILFEESSSPGVVGRFDWHLWQLAVALMPAGIACCIAAWARNDMEQHFGGGRLSFTNKRDRGASLVDTVEETAAVERGLESREQALEERVAQLERQLSSLQAGAKRVEEDAEARGGDRGRAEAGRDEPPLDRPRAPAPDLPLPIDAGRTPSWADGVRRVAGGAWRGLRAAGAWIAGVGGAGEGETGRGAAGA